MISKLCVSSNAATPEAASPNVAEFHDVDAFSSSGKMDAVAVRKAKSGIPDTTSTACPIARAETTSEIICRDMMLYSSKWTADCVCSEPQGKS